MKGDMRMTLEEQVAQLTGRVFQLEKDVEKLKANSLVQTEKGVKPAEEPVVESKAEPVEKAVVEAVTVEEPVVVSEAELKTEIIEEPEPMVQESPKPMIQEEHRTIYPEVQRHKPVVKDNSSVEKTFGIKVMAVLASLLVFVSLILFGSLIYEYIPEVGKIGIMALISGIFAVTGLVNMKKSTHKVLFSAFAGCGIGGLYITIFVAAFLLESIHLVSMLVMLGIWTVFVMILSRFMSKMFTYICYAGVAITSVYFGYFGEGSPVAIIFYFVSVLLLFALNYSGSFAKDAFFLIQLPVAAVVLVLFYEKFMWVFIAMAVMLAVVKLAQLFVYKVNRKDVPFIIIFDVLTYAGILIISFGLKDNFRGINYIFEVVAAVFVLIAVVTGLKYYKKTDVLYYPVFYLTAISLVVIPYCDFVTKYIGASVFMLALLVAGLLTENRHFKYVGYSYFIIYAFQMGGSMGIDAPITILVMLVAVALVFAFNRVKYSMADKYAAVVGVLILICELCTFDYLNHPTVFMLLAIVSLVINNRWFNTNPKTGENENASLIIAYILNASLMIFGSILMLECECNMRIVKDIEDSCLLSIMIIALLTIAMFAINSAELFKQSSKEPAVGVYICFKFTWLVWVILSRLEAQAYTVSLAGMAIALACIILGFSLKKKPFRLYGLVLSIICVIKLVLIDIEYNYVIMKPLSYLLAGVLCFGISWIYSRIEKKEKSEE